MLVTASQQIPFLEKIRRKNVLVERQFGFLRRFFTPRTVFLHYGAHDCSLALMAAGYVERVYAVDVADGVTEGVRLPCNLRFIDSRSLWSVGEGTVDVSFSERLPITRLGDVHRGLARRGVHVFQASDESARVDELVRGAGFSAFRKHWLANLLHQPKLMTAHK